VTDLERRLSALEGGTAQVPRAPVSTPPAAPSATPAPAPVESDLAVALSLVGRTLLALGGAYLLRAVTEAGALPQALGVAIGLGYACAWIYVADRAGGAGRTASAAFHGAAAALVGYPIIWETTVRLRLIAPVASAALVLAFSLALLAVVRRSRLKSTAWVAQVAVVVTAFALMGGTRQVVPYAAVLAAVGVAALWLGYDRAWPSLQWFAAAVADVAVVLVTFGAIAQKEAVPAPAALAVQLFLFLAYFASFHHWTSAENRTVNLFEIVQCAAATLLGLGGALAVAGAPFARAAASLFGLGVALVSLRRALRDWREPRLDRNGLFFSSLAVASLLLATSTSIPGPAYLWTALAVVGFVSGSRLGQIALSLQGGVLLLAASASSGLLTGAGYAFGAPATASWPRASLSEPVVVAAALVCAAWSLPDAPTWGPWRGAPRALSLFVALTGCGSAALHLLGPLLAGGPGAVRVDAAVLASVRTAVLSLSAVALGMIARKGLREALGLLYPLLVVAGIKLILEDFAHGRAGTLFVALAFYGCALIIAPRLARGHSR
jgi:hypothetical protein